MALRTAIAKRFHRYRVPSIGDTAHSPFISPSSQKTLTAAIPNSHHRILTLPESSSSTVDAGFFRQCFHQRQTNQSPKLSWPELFHLPVGEKLSISNGEHLRMDGQETENAPCPSDTSGLSVGNVRKIIRCSQLQEVRSALKVIPSNSISYNEFVQICSDVCSNRDRGVEFAKLLDLAGDVIVLGNVVFLRPDQVAKSIEKLISQSIAIPNDPRKQELEELERQKALIDQKAKSQVHGELYCGLGFLFLQTLGFIRLTFWELSWDVMEPICFFVTSLHFVLGYIFFLRTSKEPTFECYFQSRFRVKQRQLMEVHNFDYKKYNELCKAFYPNYQRKFSGIMEFPHSGSSTVFG